MADRPSREGRQVSVWLRRVAMGAYIQVLLLGVLRPFSPRPCFAQSPRPPANRSPHELPIILAQVPADRTSRRDAASGQGVATVRADGARLLLVNPDGSTRVLSQGFHSACDPDVSFDGKRVLFAGKRESGDRWNIYEARLDGSGVRQVTRHAGNCRSPGYQSTLYTIVSTEPWYQLTFVSDAAGAMNERGNRVSQHLYSCKLDGTSVRRITYNLSDDGDPCLMGDGRLLYACWQRGTLNRSLLGRVALFGINIDGTDDALFADPAGKRQKRMPCVTTKGVVVFVEADRFAADGSGQLARVDFRRPLKTYRSITKPADGDFHSPSPWPDGRVLVSRRPRGDTASHGICLLDPRTGVWQEVFDDPARDDIQARAVRRAREPDGRSSVVNEEYPNGKLYCLNVYVSDIPGHNTLRRSSIRRLRVLEGVPISRSQADAYIPPLSSLPAWRPGTTRNGLPPLVQRRILGEIDVCNDGSFNIEVPANTPVELQTLDENGMALRSCNWIWARNRERRGCIGCHEDGELVPENVFVQAVKRPSIQLTLPPERRRTVDFRRDVMPIIEQKCVPCHGPRGAPPRLDGGMRLVREDNGKSYFNRAYLSLLETNHSRATTKSVSPDRVGAVGRSGDTPDNVETDHSRPTTEFSGKYVHPGRARTSPLTWHLFGRNTSRPWDGEWIKHHAHPIPPGSVKPLTNRQRRTFVEWIDMGALWDGIPGMDPLPSAQ